MPIIELCTMYVYTGMTGTVIYNQQDQQDETRTY